MFFFFNIVLVEVQKNTNGIDDDRVNWEDKKVTNMSPL